MLMTHGTSQLPNDSESLQADVMRFMAIIAFCLIAILTLVKNAEPAPESQPEPETRAQLEVAIEVQALEPESEPTAPMKSLPAEPLPALVPVITVAEIEPVAPAPPVEMPAPVAEVLQTRTAEPARDQPPTMDEPEEPAPLPEIADETAEEPGLILRFTSDGDFLRLIARGDITVYAFQAQDVLSLNESYRFLDAHSPGQVYELLRGSIPSLIVDALKQERADISDFRWGIALPTHISAQIERHLGTVTRGQLVIDRYGDVHHVAAS